MQGLFHVSDSRVRVVVIESGRVERKGTDGGRRPGTLRTCQGRKRFRDGNQFFQRRQRNRWNAIEGPLMRPMNQEKIGGLAAPNQRQRCR